MSASSLIRQFWLVRRGAGEARALRRRFVSLDPLTLPDSARLEDLAMQLRKQREHLAASLGILEACKACVRPRSEQWPGGHCCSGSTARLFPDDELVALRLSGTKGRDLLPPFERTQGCAFRGRNGCTLPPAHRPNLCVRYTCRELESELARRGDLEQIAVLQQRMRVTFDEFCAELKRARERERERERDWELSCTATGRPSP